MACNNIEIVEETQTGVGTSHQVNGIIVQTTMHGPHQNHLVKLPRKPKQRSVLV